MRMRWMCHGCHVTVAQLACSHARAFLQADTPLDSQVSHTCMSLSYIHLTAAACLWQQSSESFDTSNFSSLLQISERSQCLECSQFLNDLTLWTFEHSKYFVFQYVVSLEHFQHCATYAVSRVCLSAGVLVAMVHGTACWVLTDDCGLVCRCAA